MRDRVLRFIVSDWFAYHIMKSKVWRIFPWRVRVWRWKVWEAVYLRVRQPELYQRWQEGSLP